jgi:hypothetical protein
MLADAEAARRDTPLGMQLPVSSQASSTRGDERKRRNESSCRSKREMTHRSCPKCRHWHDVAIGCDPRVALDAYVAAVSDSEQATADAAETLTLARYWTRCRGW